MLESYSLCQTLRRFLNLANSVEAHLEKSPSIYTGHRQQHVQEFQNLEVGDQLWPNVITEGVHHQSRSSINPSALCQSQPASHVQHQFKHTHVDPVNTCTGLIKTDLFSLYCASSLETGKGDWGPSGCSGRRPTAANLETGKVTILYIFSFDEKVMISENNDK